MSSPPPSLSALEDLVTDEFFDQQNDTETRRFVPYSFTQGLRKAMAHIDPEDIQELEANRSFNTDREKIDAVVSSPISDIFDGEFLTRKQFDLDFDKAEGDIFPWADVQDILGSKTVYDLPVRHLVVQFEHEEFEQEWQETIESAIDQDVVPTSWVDSQFYAVLESAKPEDSDARENVRDHHEEFYFKPKFESEEDYEGMDWQVRTLDLQSVWSHQAFVNRSEPLLTQHFGDRQLDWTARRLERFIMNYFAPDENYTGVLRNNEFASLWRRVYSRDVTSIKRFEWEEGEEWVLTEAD